MNQEEPKPLLCILKFFIALKQKSINNEKKRESFFNLELVAVFKKINAVIEF